KWTYQPPLVDIPRRSILAMWSTKIISNAATDALGQIQTEIKQVSQIALENHLALDGLLAAQGGVCAVINRSCCVYVNEKKQIQTDINQVWQASHLFHQISQGATIGSGPAFSCL
uniref:ERVV2 protein n=1 Tax=Anser cygnoides TaxID=8845 RepID=A0A8B9EF27_ANSCY